MTMLIDNDLRMTVYWMMMTQLLSSLLLLGPGTAAPRSQAQARAPMKEFHKLLGYRPIFAYQSWAIDVYNGRFT